MFNSDLIEITTELNNGKRDMSDPVVQAYRKTHLEILDYQLDAWRDAGETDESFIENFGACFPPGFLRRDLQRAKNIIYDLYDIAVSDVLRIELSPIYTYVMYNIIQITMEDWCEADIDVAGTKEILKYLEDRNAPGYIKAWVTDWFSDDRTCADDFSEIYNGDYTSTRFAEQVALMYLDYPDGDARLQMLGVTIDEFFDLLPNDMRERCIEKYSNEKNTGKISSFSPVKSHGAPTLFISYSWDSEDHKKWVKDLSDRLTDRGIHTILDQKDLVLGDPLPLFMESAISQSDYVLIICTPQYKAKADARRGGVGYEESIITGDVFSNQNHRKYITVLASGTWETSVPIWATGKLGADLSEKSFDTEEFQRLVATIKGAVQKNNLTTPPN